MRQELTFRRMNGEDVTLHAWFTLDGAIQFWEAVHPSTGERVELCSADKWFAVAAMHRAVMTRGAA